MSNTKRLSIFTGDAKNAPKKGIQKAQLHTEQWIVKAINAHGDLYDYSDVVYVNARTKVRIICNIHGAFEQIPRYHASATKPQHCPVCAAKTLCDANRRRSIENKRVDKKAKGWFNTPLIK